MDDLQRNYTASAIKQNMPNRPMELIPMPAALLSWVIGDVLFDRSFLRG
jgi:hypothetical protein